MADTPELPALPYARPSRAPEASRSRAAALIVFGGLGLLFTGGCFLVGVHSLVPRMDFAGKTTSRQMSAGEVGLMWVLYLAAFSCFAAGAWYLSKAAGSLLSVMRGELR